MRFVYLFLTVSACAYAQPTITSARIQNAASNTLPGTPGGAIGQGSLFILYGLGLGPNTLVSTGYPLQKVLAGTSVSVTVNGTKVDALMVYTLATQVAVLLPSSTPTGKGTITLTYNGAISATAKIQVVASSFGVFTLNQSGIGPAVVQNFVSATNLPVNTLMAPAVAGQTLILYGTGLGPVTFDESGPPVAADMATNLDLYVGGKKATVLFHGRSPCCAGLDQINFIVPTGVESCFAPVAIVTGGVTSNVASIAVAPAGSSVCSSSAGLSTTDLLGAQVKGGLRLSAVNIRRNWAGLGKYYESASGGFFNVPTSRLLVSPSLLNEIPLGSCTVSPGVNFSPFAGLPTMDAGAALTLTGASASFKLTRGSSGTYTQLQGSGANTPVVLIQGGFSLDNGLGGNDVKGFNATASAVAPGLWTNQASFTTVDRSKDQTVTWSSTDPNGVVRIWGTSSGTSDGDFPGNFVTFSCYERATAGSFTIPAWILSTLPAIPATNGDLYVGSLTLSPRFTAPGLDFWYFMVELTSDQFVGYK